MKNNHTQHLKTRDTLGVKHNSKEFQDKLNKMYEKKKIENLKLILQDGFIKFK